MVRIQPMKVRTRNGYPAAGKGDEVGSRGGRPRGSGLPSRQQHGGHDSSQAHPQGEGFRRADHDKRSRPERDAADIGGNAGLKARGIASQEQALAGEEGQNPAATQSLPSR